LQIIQVFSSLKVNNYGIIFTATKVAFSLLLIVGLTGTSK